MPHREDRYRHEPRAERYSELPLTTRAFLETLDDQGIVELANLLRFYRELGRRESEDGRPFAKEFLLRSSPRTLEWLRDARAEEIDRLDDAIRLIGSSQTIGRLLWWALATIIGAFILGSQLGDWMARLVGFTRGGK